jgi:hypothetical protein
MQFFKNIFKCAAGTVMWAILVLLNIGMLGAIIAGCLHLTIMYHELIDNWFDSDKTYWATLAFFVGTSITVSISLRCWFVWIVNTIKKKL